MSDTASSPVCSDHSLSCVAMEWRSRAAVSCAATRADCDLTMRMRRRAASVWVAPRRERKEKAPWAGPLVWEAADLLPLFERMENALCLGGVSWWHGGVS